MIPEIERRYKLEANAIFVPCNAFQNPESLLKSASTAHVGRMIGLRLWAHRDIQNDWENQMKTLRYARPGGRGFCGAQVKAGIPYLIRDEAVKRKTHEHVLKAIHAYKSKMKNAR